MKNFIFFIIILITHQSATAQSDLLRQKEFAQYLKELPAEMDSIRDLMPRQDHDALFNHIDETNFKLDTMYIEKIYRKEIDLFQTTLGMSFAAIHAEERYDSLLNVYYKRLLHKLTPTDRDVLKTTQRNWLKFRNTEYDLNALIWEAKYSDGGSIHRIFAAQKRMDITRQRVIELFSYYSRIWR